MGGQITLYDGNYGTKRIVETFTDSPYRGRITRNDEARSLKLNMVRKGCKITVFDLEDAGTDDDYCIIEVKQLVPEYIVPSFEESYSDDTVKVTFIKKDGLDGDVSYIKIH